MLDKYLPPRTEIVRSRLFDIHVSKKRLFVFVLYFCAGTVLSFDANAICNVSSRFSFHILNQNCNLCLFVSLSLYLSLSVYLSIYLSIYLSTELRSFKAIAEFVKRSCDELCSRSVKQ